MGGATTIIIILGSVTRRRQRDRVWERQGGLNPAGHNRQLQSWAELCNDDGVRG